MNYNKEPRFCNKIASKHRIIGISRIKKSLAQALNQISCKVEANNKLEKEHSLMDS